MRHRSASSGSSVATAPATGPAATATSAAAAGGAGGVDATWVQAGASAAKMVLAIFLLFPIGPLVKGGLVGCGLVVRKVVRGLGLGMIAAMLLVPWYCWVSLATEKVSHWVRHGLAPVHPVLKELRENRVPLEQGLLIGTAVLSAPLIEEILFRGLLQTYLLRFGLRRSPRAMPSAAPASEAAEPGPIPPIPLDYLPSVSSSATVSPAWRWLCILFVSALFAAIHIPIMGPEAFAPLFLLAVTLGYMYERTGNLWACMTLHALFNLTNIAVNFL